MLGGFLAIAALIFFVMAHEAGHFIAAKLTNMKATQFFFGFGPKIFSLRRGETEYGVKAIPAGGYVRIIGMNPYEEVDPADIGRTYREKKFWEKSFVVLAGVVVNMGIAVLLLFAMFMIYGQVTDEVTPIVSGTVAEIDGVASPAVQAGIVSGDRILSVAGVPIETWDQVPDLIRPRAGEVVEIIIDRNGETITLNPEIVSVTDEEGTHGMLGVAPTLEIEDVSVVTAIGLAGQTTWEFIKLSYQFLWDLVTGLDDLARVFVGGDLADESRPVSVVGIARLGSQSDAIGGAGLLSMMAGVNIILAIMNSLPVFPLDGGHFAVALVEKVTRRSVDIKYLVPVAAAVILLFVFLGVVSVYLDIVDPFVLN